MTVADLLRAGWSLIDAPDKWCQVSMAEDAHGHPLSPWRDRARVVRRCSQTALRDATSLSIGEAPADALLRPLVAWAAAGDLEQRAVDELNRVARETFGAPSYFAFNDAPSTTWGQVREMWQTAIVNAEAIYGA